MNRNLASGLALAALLAAGCNYPWPDRADPGAADPGPSADLPVLDVPSGDLPGDLPADRGDGDTAAPDVPRDAVLPADAVPAQSFRFRMAGREGDAFVIEVVSRDLPAVFGMALRVEWDPARMALVGAQAAPVLGDEGAGEAIYKVAEIRPGSLALALTNAYYLWDDALPGDTVVATLRLKPLDGRPADLSFFPARCLVVDHDLGRVDATYLASVVYP
jgi:hypothetical protein